MAKSISRDKSFTFAVRIVRLSQYIRKEHREFVLSRQLLRSGTAVGALIRESEFSQSKPDYISKMSIALKEANETLYWLDLLKETGYLLEHEHRSIISDANELVAMLVATVKTAKANSKLTK